MIDPREIEEVEFKTTRFSEGYDQDEVDNFLDRVALELRNAHTSNSNLEAENQRLRRKVAELERVAQNHSEAPTTQLPVIQAQPTESAARLLELAQKTADDVVAQAQQNAVDITARADESARDIVNEATQEADRRRRAAEGEAYRAEEKLKAIIELRDTTRKHLDAQLSDLRTRLGGDQ